MQNEADNPFTNHIVYTPTNSTQKATEVDGGQEETRKQKDTSKISPGKSEQQLEEKLASTLPMENTSKPYLSA